MRKNLYIFRHSKTLSQGEIAKIIGCSRATYSAIETGARMGSMRFWRKLQLAFHIPDADIGALMRVEKDERKGATV